MTRQQASQALRDELNKNGLTDWGIRLNQNADSHFLGLCSYKDRTIILSAHHIDIHPTPDVINTIKHEVAHALVGLGHGHDDIWAAKAKEIGCDNTSPCSNLSLSPAIIDAIRSGATVEVTFDEQVIRTPKYTITRLQDRCPTCNKVAVTKSEKLIEILNEAEPDLKFIELECGHSIVKKIPKGTPFHKFQFGGLLTCKHDWDKNKCIKCGRFRPYDFQIDGMRFGEIALASCNGVGIFDEMGLGKTIQAEGLVYYHPELCDPCLWVVKSGLKYQFSKSILNWMGDKHVPQVVNSSKDWLIPGLKNYIIGYDMFVPKSRTLKSGKVINQGFDITQFDRIGIKCVVLDECQQIKNVDSTRTQMVRRVVKGRKVIALSGTPWKNRGSELFPVLNMLDYMKFNSEEKFKRDWVEYYWDKGFKKEGGIIPRRIAQFKEFIKDIVIRRERTEVMSELPLVNRTKLLVQMNQAESEAYDVLVEEFVAWYEENIAAMTGMAIIAAMQKMRHLVALAKVPATLEYIDEFIEDTDRKIVIFAHHQDVQEHLYLDLKAKYGDQMPVVRIISDMSGQARFETAEAFNAAPRAIMVASQLAAGEGINLQTCCDCLMHERQWNPGNEEQCEGRFIRIGQTSESVNAVYAHLEGITTIDPQLDGIVEGKRIRFHKAMSMNPDMAQSWSPDDIMKDLAAAIVSAHRQKKSGKK